MKKAIAPGKVSKAEQRVIIAKDALAQLKAEKLVACQGMYIGSELYAFLKDEANGDDDQQAQPVLKNVEKRLNYCRVCAKGALFLSAVRKYNKATVDDILCDYMKVAENIFGDKQFDLIEAAFEQWDYFQLTPDGGGDPVPEEAIAFGKEYEEDNDRLQAILKNIIVNKGTFKP